ncbi:hypothetical protein DIC82_18040 [Clostridium beijerinckii]|nr:hypothetical protein DIC82_18040 [Clostridium beijerinckii]
MNKGKYQSKTLIAEYQYLTELEDFRFSETAYRLKDGSIVIEYNGEPHSLYGLRLSFTKNVGRKGIFSISNYDYKSWKAVAKMRSDSSFVDWEEEMNEQFQDEHENVLKCVGENELPF